MSKLECKFKPGAVVYLTYSGNKNMRIIHYIGEDRDKGPYVRYTTNGWDTVETVNEYGIAVTSLLKIFYSL